MGDLLYVDSSSLLTWALGQPGDQQIEHQIGSWQDSGGTPVSSRLLSLEVRRTVVRERLSGNDIEQVTERQVRSIVELPLTDEVWKRAAAIEQHLRSLDAIHLATCELVGATLLTAGLDTTIRDAAAVRGIPTI